MISLNTHIQTKAKLIKFYGEEITFHINAEQCRNCPKFTEIVAGKFFWQ